MCIHLHLLETTTIDRRALFWTQNGYSLKGFDETIHYTMKHNNIHGFFASNVVRHAGPSGNLSIHLFFMIAAYVIIHAEYHHMSDKQCSIKL